MPHRPSDQALILAVEQNFKVARYAERNIQLFAGGYLAIFGGSFVAATRDWTNSPILSIPEIGLQIMIIPLLILLVLSLTSLVGLFLTFKFTITLYYYSKYARKICQYELNLEGKIAPSLRNHPVPELRTPIIVNTAPWILAIYAVVFSASVAWISYLLTYNYKYSAGLLLILLPLLIVTIYYKMEEYMNNFDEYIEGLSDGWMDPELSSF